MNYVSFYQIRFGFLVVFVTLLCLFFTVSVQAEDLYIGQSSAGGDTGADCANQKSAAWFNTAESWGAGANKISAGDTVHLCGTINTALEVQDSGSSGSPITILFESGAKISKTACGPNGCLNTNSKTYITIDGGTDGTIESTDMGTGLGGNSADYNIGIKAGGCNNCEIKNLNIRNMYVRTSNNDVLNSSSTKLEYNKPIGIQFNGSNIKVHDNALSDHGTAIQNFYDNDETGVEVYNNEISRVGHSYSLAGANAKTTQGIFKYYGNYIHDYANWDSENCAIAHTSGIHVYGNWNGSKIYGNGELWIYNNKIIGSGVCATGQIFTETGTSPWTEKDGTSTAHLYVFNNLLLSGPDALAGNNILGAGGGNVQVYNNTVIGNGLGTCTVIGRPSTTMKMKNNYFAGCAVLMSAFQGSAVSPAPDLDYNVYAKCSGYNCFWVGTCDVSNFEAYRASSVVHDFFDIHSSADLKGTGGVDTTTGRPGIGSLVINKGLNLSSLGYKALNADLEGVLRGADAWDIGVYKYNQLQPPNKLRILP